MFRFSRFFNNFDWVMLGATLLLLSFGISIIFSTTFSIAGGSEALQQLMFAGVGLVGLLALARIDYRVYRNYSGILYIITLVLLLLTKFLGHSALGATRWINLGFFQFQPSELAKVFMVIVMAKFFSDNIEQINRPSVIIKSIIYIGIPIGLVAWQPDLGTAMTFGVIWIAMMLVSNVNKWYLVGMGTLGLASLFPIYQFLLHDYQRQRILSFMNPTADPMGSGWNVNQAMIAIGSGQFWGRGLGHGPQSQLNFIPFKHTDFVFAALAEEMGFVGAFSVILLFTTILYRAVKIAQVARDYFGMFLATGIFAILFFHVFINIGMNLGIMPVTGIPLPLLSSGGTSVVVTMLSIGILESVYIRYKKIDF